MLHDVIYERFVSSSPEFRRCHNAGGISKDNSAMDTV